MRQAMSVLFREAVREGLHNSVDDARVFGELLVGIPHASRPLGVVEHAGAHAIAAARADEDIVVDAALAAFPECLVISEWSVLSFMTAAPDVRLKILACGQRRRARVKVMCLMRLESPHPRYSSRTMRPEVVT